MKGKPRMISTWLFWTLICPNKQYIKFLLAILCLLIPTKSAHSFERLRFQPVDSYKEKTVLAFIKTHNKIPDESYLLATTDLNDDFIDEYILRPQFEGSCPNKPLCPYQIVAFQDHEPILIGQFDAHKILISDKKTYGIRHLIVYNGPHNDFKHETAIWNPFAFRFKIP